MNILSINNISRMGRDAPLFSDVTFGMDEGDKAAIIGRNGTGKSTLLSVIAGTLNADDGQVVINKSAGVSYLPQNPSFNGEDSIREHIFKSNSPKLMLINEYEDLCDKMSNGLSETEQARFDKLTLDMDSGNLWNYEAQIKSILGTLGINDLSRKMKTLSGGMLKKVALAQVLVEDTKLLLLDEPTNHLDVQTIYWLQNYLHETSRCVLMVTHDRYFLDAVCNNIYELARGKLKLYQGNYSTYLE
ncbi:MAG: ABC-F family ATP-binding cassette domain-containing protein, partial [Treponema sp.]|nr:ABC-F family ATP-binding cassette domain-containing protein [Treponema sp.]